LGIAYQGAGEVGPLRDDNLTRAFALRDRVTERERFIIENQYYDAVPRDWNKGAEVAELWSRTYPRDYVALNSLGSEHALRGESEAALHDFLEGYRIEPRNAFLNGNVINIYITLDRFDEAKQVAETELAQNPEETRLHNSLLRIAFIQGDSASSERQIQWFTGKPEEYTGLQRQAEDARTHGRLRQADDLFRQANELRQRHRLPEVPTTSAEFEALRGNCALARDANAATAVALALCGDAAQAARRLKQAEETSVRRPDDTPVNEIELPMLRAVAELKRDQPAKAVELLQPVARYERARPEIVYLRGQSYLLSRKGSEAANEFQKVIDHKGASWGPFYPASYVGLARAAALAGDVPRARKAYQDFLALWKDADPDIRILIQAQMEYAALK
jgi:predicted Zn-dependent protease